ncbi:hypothetical protein GCM10023321_85420 [Pseudonocardia eucalypti]|uniref:HTH gntR-type domain-containing protein n=1 Tax=Pseudonocardia eucalypti TaxID=648755 RepID=A0ABP9RG82_9PSEU|nr:DNA-binding GntR family transcriptional regulator [Pseudonocardia eucalypti]
MTESEFLGSSAIESVADRVTADIRRAILAGRLRPGQELTLRTLAAQLRVSYIPVREAMRSLAAEGLLVIRPGRSALVPRLEAEELRAVSRLRRLVEPELATRHRTGVDEAHLDLLSVRWERCASWSRGPDEHYQEFHAIYLALLSTSVPHWEMGVARMLCHTLERYLRNGVSDHDGSPGPPNALLAALGELIATARTGDLVATRTKVAEFVDLGGQIAWDGLPLAAAPPGWPTRSPGPAS